MNLSPDQNSEGSIEAATPIDPETDAPREKNAIPGLPPEPTSGNALAYAATPADRRRAAIELLVARLRGEAE